MVNDISITKFIFFPCPSSIHPSVASAVNAVADDTAGNYACGGWVRRWRQHDAPAPRATSGAM
ncbi:uncharacterized protein PITG_11821 [Phytophthora infestans T30-4]|uniref:Uncharacterized protein n=1 Tax=Phytophthora infestans (strain T30-4) TaxID=403677 RepID=D0NHW4_PHYIT|nr:uncharacterized protein PITG_11821 [Phytophthora infestans T30-4]EEY58839.1 hypothetical protein PITG_11821 [Phytophthora infestans T30-4]|eukprot:XP_002901312.1 hypothetical protein PITG_11821 [Phytophthora infestans T30-4]